MMHPELPCADGLCLRGNDHTHRVVPLRLGMYAPTEPSALVELRVISGFNQLAVGMGCQTRGFLLEVAKETFLGSLLGLHPGCCYRHCGGEDRNDVKVMP